MKRKIESETSIPSDDVVTDQISSFFSHNLKKKKIELEISKLSADVVIDQIGSFLALSSKEIIDLALMNKEYYTLFKQNIQPKRIALSTLLKSFISCDQEKSGELLKAYPEFKINQLLWYVVSGEQVKAEEMLKQNPKYLLKRGSVIDMSGRHFNNITPFELVLWNMDVRYMAGMMLKCIPENEDGIEIRKKLLLQFDDVEENGVSYTLKGKKYKESHFSYQPLIDALNRYSYLYFCYYYPVFGDEEEDLDEDSVTRFWCEDVGSEQLMLTIEGRNQYCHLTRSLYGDILPTFDEEVLGRNLKFSSMGEDKELVWDSRLVGLGTNFAILRDEVDKALCTDLNQDPGESRYSSKDGIAIERLSKVRTQDLLLLRNKLEESIMEEYFNWPSTQEGP